MKKDSESSSYKEELIMLPDKIESIMDFRIENDGIIRIAGASNQTREGGIWESKDGGKTWNELYSYTDILKIDQKKRIECFPHLSNCDEVLCMVFHFKNDGSLDSSTRSYLLNATGECTEVMNKFPKSSVPDSSRIGDDISFIGCILDGNNLLLSNESGELYVVDKKSSEVIHRVCKKGNALLSPDSYMIDGNNLYCISQINTFKYDLEKNEIVEEEEKSLEKLANAYVKSDRPTVIDAENESYYIAENDGIKKYADGKSKPMVQAKDMSIIPSDVYLNKLFVTEDEKFYLSCNSENDPPMLLLYTPRKENSDKSQKELNVYTLQEDDNVKKMIDYYQKSNKEIEINLTVGMNDNKTEDDAIKKLNTQILAGDGGCSFHGWNGHRQIY